MLKSEGPNYHVKAHVHCYLDDQRFDGIREGIWRKPEAFLEVVRHYDGVLGIDFSTYCDMPEPIKRFQLHRMRVMEHWMAFKGIHTIPNVRWGTSETWDYCFDALPYNSLVAIGVVGSGLRRLENRPLFDAGLYELVTRKAPSGIAVVGSTDYPVFDKLARDGVRIYQFDSDTCKHYKKDVTADV